jgi:hypothetical protein
LAQDQTDEILWVLHLLSRKRAILSFKSTVEIFEELRDRYCLAADPEGKAMFVIACRFWGINDIVSNKLQHQLASLNIEHSLFFEQLGGDGSTLGSKIEKIINTYKLNDDDIVIPLRNVLMDEFKLDHLKIPRFSFSLNPCSWPKPERPPTFYKLLTPLSLNFSVFTLIKFFLTSYAFY